jgi:hypothetical protein
MYDYLAKIILLGPSGTGKYAHLPRARLLQCCRQTLTQLGSLDPAYYTDL